MKAQSLRAAASSAGAQVIHDDGHGTSMQVEEENIEDDGSMQEDEEEVEPVITQMLVKEEEDDEIDELMDSDNVELAVEASVGDIVMAQEIEQREQARQMPAKRKRVEDEDAVSCHDNFSPSQLVFHR